MDIKNAMALAAYGMRAQGARLKVIAENVANAGSTAPEPGQDPYRRKVITFRNEMDRALGLSTVQVDRVRPDQAPFVTRFDPGHPSADAEGYVKLPNVNTLIELADLREAQRSYEANVSMIELSKTMLARTIDLLRG